ncbi:hypothetical protein [Spirosoma foliorum]|uniref:Uncharacterized protein n=1 Tax=Spirosoma foliorum TaxID=2710596 RepID=A0A7G5H2M6_9BACT|nr:hypothetical protein [Spirosoma foliorum]QMW05368.1 hypothetical protein H3H32_10985 [Spirosoma foliorum]
MKTPKLIGYINVFLHGIYTEATNPYPTRKEADRYDKTIWPTSEYTRVACIEVFEGQGLKPETK